MRLLTKRMFKSDQVSRTQVLRDQRMQISQEMRIEVEKTTKDDKI
jgi:hypothetical protein